MVGGIEQLYILKRTLRDMIYIRSSWQMLDEKKKSLQHNKISMKDVSICTMLKMCSFADQTSIYLCIL